MDIYLINDTFTALPGGGTSPTLVRAKKEFLALLLNVASLRLLTTTIVSQDFRTVSEAIQQIAASLTDSNPDNDDTAWIIALLINAGDCDIPAGTIDPGSIYDVIPYKPVTLGTAFLGAGPTPTREPITVSYNLAHREHVSVRVFSVDGRLVQELINGTQSSGRHSLVWSLENRDGSRAPAGVYFMKVRLGATERTSRVVLLK